MTSEPTQLALETVEEAEDAPIKKKVDTVTLSSGVEVSGKAVPLPLLQDIQKKYWKLEPKPPVFFIKTKGRKEENFDDPEYKIRHERWNQEMIMAQMDVMLLKGLTIVNIPKTTEGWKNDDDDNLPEWLEDLLLIGHEINLSPRSRYLHWLKYVCCPTAPDIQAVSTLIAKKTGISEEEVQESARRFRD